MKIVSYNVNGLRSRLSSPPRTLSAFLDSLDADIICLQETKVARHELTADIAVAEGYESFFSCTRTVRKGRIGYSGVATFCRVGIVPACTSAILPVAADEGFTGLLHRSLNGVIEAEKGRVGCYEEVARTKLSMQELLQLDSEGRCLITDHGSFVLFNLYCPRAGCGDTDRLEFKINFFLTLQRRWEALLKQNRRIIAIGDFNISPYAIDSCAPGPDFDQNICRQWLRSLLRVEGGPFWDVFRFFHENRRDAYTCWSQSSGAEEFNFGTRIDLILAAGGCNHQAVPQSSSHDETPHDFVQCEVNYCDILSQFRRVKPDAHPRWQGGRSLKLEGSDHAPIFLQLKVQSPVQPHEVPPLAARFMPEIRGRQQNLISLLRRQPAAVDAKDIDSKIKTSEVELASAAVAPLVTSPQRYVESTSLFDVKRKAKPSPVGSSKKLHRPVTFSADRRKQGIDSVQKSDLHQKDLRAFFESSSQARISLAKAEEFHKAGAYGSEQDPGRNVGLDITVSDCSKSPTVSVIVREQESHQLKSGLINSREGYGQSKIESDMRLGGTDLDPVLRQQGTSVGGIKNANAAWNKIKEKMARAVPLCKGHDEPCVGRVVKKPGPNKGRGFYVCARAEGPASNPEARCDHFEWASTFKKAGILPNEKNDSDQPQSYVK